MKNLKTTMFIKSLFLFGIIFFIQSCNGLSEGSAKEILKENLPEHQKYCYVSLPEKWVGDYKSHGGFCSVIVTNEPYRSEADKINYYIKKGLLKLKKKRITKDCAEWKEFKLVPTPKAKPYLMSKKGGRLNFITAEYEVDDILNIKPVLQDNHYKEVEYVLRRKKITPFGEYKGQLRNCEKEKHRSKIFVQSNKGWMIDD